MKKFVVMAAALALVSGTVFAKSWTNNIGVGASIPASKIASDDDAIDETVTQAGFAFDFTYLGIAESGFAVKVNYDVGAVTSEDIGDDDDTGSFNALTFGAGWAFVNEESFTFAATGMIGFDYTEYDLTASTTELLSFSIGADIYASIKLMEHFGLYADLGLYYLPSGTAKVETSIGDSEFDLKGKYRVSPTVGVCWKF